MQRIWWLVLPLVTSSCMWARDHERDHDHPDDYDYGSSWEYDTAFELEARGDARQRSGAGDAPDACVVDEDETSTSAHKRTPSEHEPEPRCQSNSDCEASNYCEQESGECVQGETCEDESSCEAGFNCDPESSLCTPADMERCSELASEALCAERDDCIATYAGIDCTCGPDCTCTGGEPGCVCESFEFHTCADVSDAAQ